MVGLEAFSRGTAAALSGFGVAFLIGFSPGDAGLLLRLALRGIFEGWIMDFYAIVAQVVDLPDQSRIALGISL